MIRHIVAASFSLALLTGCAAENIAKGLNPLMGQPIDTVYKTSSAIPMARPRWSVGMPMSGRTRARAWCRSRRARPPASSAPVPFSATTGGVSMLPFQTSCQIRVFVNGPDIITGWDFKGHQDGCAPYARRFLFG